MACAQYNLRTITITSLPRHSHRHHHATSSQIPDPAPPCAQSRDDNITLRAITLTLLPHPTRIGIVVRVSRPTNRQSRSLHTK
jgi:hypothetical protein